MTPDYRVVIIGAGVVGLAAARALAEKRIESVLIIESEPNFGRGISGRSCEVIHSSIYNPENSYKTTFCIRGRNLLYDYCETNNIDHQRIGKIIIANESQENALKDLYQLGISKRMDDLRLLTAKEIKDLEPFIQGTLGLFVPSTGIVDSHQLMSHFQQKSVDSNHDYLYKSRVRHCESVPGGYRLMIQSPSEQLESVTSAWVINAAGLNSDHISNLIIPKKLTPEIQFSKGNYFSLSNQWKNRFSHLVYPLPDVKHGSLGIHLSFDQTGSVKLGPDAHFLESNVEDYSIDESLLSTFYEAASAYIVGLEKNDLSPDFTGIRPKLRSKSPGFDDFYISHEKDKGFPGWINLIGIDSPGLTAAIAIGEEVAGWVLEGS